MHLESYGSVAELFRQTDVDRKTYDGGVERAFSEAMDRAVSGSHRYGLSLSGGLDTRVMLSALDRLGRSQDLSTFTLGGRGCADEVIANQLSRMARTKHTFVALDDHYLEDLLPTAARMVSLTDGMYVSHGFTEMLALQGFESADSTVLLRGHGGELAKASTAWPLHTDKRIFGMSSTEEFIPYLLGRTTHVSVGDAAREVLTDRWIETLDGASAQRSLEQSLAGVPLSPPDLCSYLYLKEYHRRVTIPSLEIFRNIADVRMPLADVGFIRSVLQGPARWRDGLGIHQALIAANCTEVSARPQSEYRRAGGRGAAAGVRARQGEHDSAPAERVRLSPLPQLRRVDAECAAEHGRQDRARPPDDRARRLSRNPRTATDRRGTAGGDAA